MVIPPAHGTLSPFRLVSGTVSNFFVLASSTYTPEENYTGPDSFTYKVNDGKVDSTDVATENINVKPTEAVQATIGFAEEISASEVSECVADTCVMI